MARLGGQAVAIDLANFSPHAGEISLDRLDGLVAGPQGARLRPIHRSQPSHLRLGSGVLVLGTGEVELGLAHEARRLGPFEENEVLVLPHRRQRGEIQLVPQPIEFPALLIVEDQFAQRFVVAEIALHEVEPGREQPSLTGHFGIEIRPAVGNEKRLWKHGAETLERLAHLLLRPCRRLDLEQFRQGSVLAFELLGEFLEIGGNRARIRSMPACLLAVVPQHERLAPAGNPLDVQPVEPGLKLSAQAYHQIAHPLAAGLRDIGRRLIGGRQFAPQLADGGERACIRPGVRQGRPDQGKILHAQFSLGGIVAQFRIGLAKPVAPAIFPRGQEVVGEIDRVALVEIDDALDAVLVAIGLGHHGMRGEDKAPRLQNNMVSHQPRRRQVLLEQRRGHGKGFAGVVEAGLVGGIDGKLSRRPEIDAGQVANGVIELGVAQATGKDRPWVAGGLLRFPAAQVANPGNDIRSLGWRRPAGRLFGRHLFRLQAFEHQLPVPHVFRDRRDGRVATEVEFRFLLLLPVTRKAIAIKERLHPRGKPMFERIGGRRFGVGECGFLGVRA